MISDKLIIDNLQHFLEQKNLFIVDIRVTPQNQIELVIDGDDYVSIDDCTDVSRYIESFLNRDIEDYSLTVSSPDANKPLKLPRQYPKHTGKDILILNNDNKEIRGKIISVNEHEIGLLVKTKDTSGKKKKMIEQEIKIPFNQIKKAKIILPF